MKLTSLIGIFALLLGSSVLAANNYYPPERVSCKLNTANNLTCSDFNRNYLVEDTYTADFPAGKMLSFTFTSGVAYYTQEDEWQVFYTYQDTKGKNVKLKTVSTSIKPDLTHGIWKKYKDEYYTCTTGYMTCLITNLP